MWEAVLGDFLFPSRRTDLLETDLQIWRTFSNLLAVLREK